MTTPRKTPAKKVTPARKTAARPTRTPATSRARAAGARIPTDRQEPLRAEATGQGTLEFRWHDRTFSIPTDAEEWPVIVSNGLARLDSEPGLLFVVLEGLLGPEQWTAYSRERYATTGDAAKLVQGIMEGLGYELGE